MLRAALITTQQHVSDYAVAIRGCTDIAVTAVGGPLQDPAKQAASLGAAHHAAGLEGLLEGCEDAFEAVILDVPVSQRPESARQAAHAGKHTLIPAPVTSDELELDGLLQTFEGAGVRIELAFGHRHHPYQETVHRSLRSGKLGVPGLIRMHSWADPDASTSMFECLHDVVDTLCWMFDDRPNRIYATSFQGTSGIQVHLGFAGGGMALADCVRSLPAPNHTYDTISAIGSLGAAYADDHHNTHLLVQADGVHARRACLGHRQIGKQLSSFADGLAHESESSNSHDGVRALAVANAALRSSLERRVAWLTEGKYELQ